MTGSAEAGPVSRVAGSSRRRRWRGPPALLASLLALILVLLGTPSGPGAARAAEAGAAGPLVCRIGVNVEDFYDLDMARDTFGAILWVWVLCPSSEVDPLPTLAFATAAAPPSLGPIETVDLPSGERYAARRAQGTFRYNWNMSHYPFDRQRVVIVIDETTESAERVVFEADTKESFLSPEIRSSLAEWTISELTLATLNTDEPSTYGLPGKERSRYAELRISFTLDRAQFLTFLKLTAGIYAAVFIAFLSFFHDANERSAFGSKLGMLVGVLFAVLINMRAVDTTIGDVGYMTLVTRIHLWTLVLIVLLALIALRDRLRSDMGERIRYPDWRTLFWSGFVYLAGLAGMIFYAARP